MQAKEVKQISTQNTNQSSCFHVTIQYFLQQKQYSLNFECPLQEAPKNFSRRQNQTLASYVHNFFLFSILFLFFFFVPFSFRFCGCYKHPYMWGNLFFTSKFFPKSQIKNLNFEKEVIL
jgi:hypothetical protein